jgi:GxxExxY protein
MAIRVDKSGQYPKSYAILGAALEGHRLLGNGFLEAVYQEAIEQELRERNIPYLRGSGLPILYSGHQPNTVYRPDFIGLDCVIVERKPGARVSEIEEAQVLNYLKISKFPAGLLLNSGTRSLGIKRFGLTPSAESA